MAVLPYKWLAAVSPLMMMGEVACDLCLPYLMSYIVNYGILNMDVHSAEDGSKLAARLITLFLGEDFTSMQVILLFGVLMLTLTVIGGFFGTMCAYTAARAAQSMGRDLRCDVFRRVMSLSIEQTDRFTTGSLVTRMTNDITMIVDFMEMLMRMFVRSPMFLIGGTIMLLSIDIKYGLVLLCAIPVLMGVMVLVFSKAVPMFKLVQERLDRVNSVVQENVSGAREIGRAHV